MIDNFPAAPRIRRRSHGGDRVMAKPTKAERRAAAEANWNGPVQDAIRDHEITEQRPIPDAVIAEAWFEFRHPSPRFNRAMAAVAQWLRGKAVIELPAPTGKPGMSHWDVDTDTTVAASVEMCSLPSVWIHDRQIEREFDPSTARRLAAALLAAADRADYLAAKDRGEAPE